MAEVTAALVKELRLKSGAGMMDCKKALDETGGDIEAAVDWLRQNGLAAAAKKSSRVAAEGLVGIATGGNSGVIVEVNAETDFVALNEQFQEFVKTVAEIGLANDGDMAAVLESGYPGSDRTVAEQLTHNISTIGENMAVRRTAGLNIKKGQVISYLHNKVADGLGKIGVMVALESEASDETLATLGKHLAMHIAATSPKALSEDDLDAKIVERERKILIEQARSTGKPEEIIMKMIEGRMRKFFEEVVLLKQISVVDGKAIISEVIEAAAKEAGTPIVLSGFIRFQLGEGIEKKTSDFAAEVKAAAGL
ncbi:MAG: elongation factor Ts [Alphaproteobacteria bacterium]|nr:MAG: elongation factor Ts [Alphaproteobacteria bacterium]